jgi:serine/threonine protein kinase/Flp pilus assembly protein TadD
MNPERFRRLMDIVGEATELEEPERSAWLVRQCGDDVNLLAEARELLDGSPSSESISDRLHAGIARAAGAVAVRAPVPDRIGPYAVTGVLGEGGMGIVYAAHQDAPLPRDVAIKVIRAGPHAPRLVARFEAERRTLAALDHPNIARIFDAGATAEGLPYFAMELVRGEPITRFCDRRGLGIAERLRLFQVVLDAVQYAHQKAVVHRDLKPSNVLVADRDARATPKVIDFGVAKVMSTEPSLTTAHTTQGTVVGTIEYMSPEQAAGLSDHVDTRSDIYSLGVLLYELLTGCLPFPASTLRTASPAELERLLRNTDPPPPSKCIASTSPDSVDRARARATDPGRLARALQGDLDNIVGVAMRKEPQRRYASVGQFSEDIARYLDGRPVRAHPATLGYRARRFVGRHRVEVVGSAVAILLLIVVSSSFTLRLARERDRAHREAVKAAQVASFLQEIFQVTDPNVRAPADISAQRLLDEGAARIESELKGQPEVQASLLTVMGATYFGLGNYDASERLLEEALKRQRALYGDQHAEVAATLHHLGRARLHGGQKPAEAEIALRDALRLRVHLLGSRDTASAKTMTTLALALRASGKFEEAEQLARQSLDIHRRSGNPDTRDHSESLHNLAFVLRSRQLDKESEATYREALAMRRRLYDPSHPELLSTMNNLAVLIDARGAFIEAESLYREVLARRTERLGPEHPQTLTSLNNLATSLWRTGRFAEAASVFREAVAVGRRVYGENATFAILLNNLGVALRRSGDLAAAERHHREALAINQKLKHEPRLAADMDNLGRVLLARGDIAGAVRLHQDALALRTRLHGGDDNPDLAESLSALGAARLAEGSVAEAERLLRRAQAIRSARLEVNDPRVAQSDFDLAVALRARGAFEESERLLRSSLVVRIARLGDGHPDVAVTLRELGIVVRYNGRLRESDSLLVESRRRAMERLGADHPDTREIEEEIRRASARSR